MFMAQWALFFTFAALFFASSLASSEPLCKIGECFSKGDAGLALLQNPAAGSHALKKVKTHTTVEDQDTDETEGPFYDAHHRQHEDHALHDKSHDDEDEHYDRSDDGHLVSLAESGHNGEHELEEGDIGEEEEEDEQEEEEEEEEIDEGKEDEDEHDGEEDEDEPDEDAEEEDEHEENDDADDDHPEKQHGEDANVQGNVGDADERKDFEAIDNALNKVNSDVDHVLGDVKPLKEDKDCP